MKTFKMGFGMFPEENVSLIFVKIIQILEKGWKEFWKLTTGFRKLISSEYNMSLSRRFLHVKINSFGINPMVIRVKMGNQNWAVNSCRHSGRFSPNSMMFCKDSFENFTSNELKWRKWILGGDSECYKHQSPIFWIGHQNIELKTNTFGLKHPSLTSM